LRTRPPNARGCSPPVGRFFLGDAARKESDTKTLIERAYAAFNERNVDAALAFMSDDVSWPKASEGGKVVGKEEIRAYWTRQ